MNWGLAKRRALRRLPDQPYPLAGTEYNMIGTKGQPSNRPQAQPGSVRGQATLHKEQLERLREKDPAFYEFLKEHDNELLGFDDEDIDDDIETEAEEAETDVEEVVEEEPDDDKDGQSVVSLDVAVEKKEEKLSGRVITTEMVDSWCRSVREDARLSSVRSLLRAFRTACHYGDDDESVNKFSVMSSSVFNKIMLVVLAEMDGALRKIFKLPPSGGKGELVVNLVGTRQWKSNNQLLMSYLGNSLHVLNQMTDTMMISYTLRRLKYSSIFLAAIPSLRRKYIKVALHFWGTGGGALPIVSFMFLRDLCIRVGSDCLDDCFKGLYKAYVMNCQFVNASKLQHLQLLQICVVELFRVDLPTAYQHAFVFIRQLAMILREALNSRSKEAFRKVYEWKFMYCLELWTGAVCAYGTESDFKLLAFPLTQIITGVARLVPTARYFPLRLRCARMLNRIASSTGTFIPVSVLLLDMLEMKELNRPPTGGVGKAVDLRTVLKVSKPTLKTRVFQEACVFSVIDEVAEHLAQWSYSLAFLELSFVPAVRLRNFCKSTKVDRFRKAMRQLVRQVEANSVFTNGKRMSVSFTPNDPAAASFLEAEKAAGMSPLSQYVATLRQKAQERADSLVESSVIIGENSSIFGKKNRGSDEDEDDDYDEDPMENKDGNAAFSSSWLPGSDAKAKPPKDSKKKKKKRKSEQEDFADDEDVVQDLVLSSDEDDNESLNDELVDSEADDSKSVPKRPIKKMKLSAENRSKKNQKSRGKRMRKRKRATSD